MSTVIETLERANPVPDAPTARALELAGSWHDVEPAALPGGQRRRFVVAIAAASIALLAAGAALALRADWIDFSAAEPAPPKVVRSFAHLDVEAPPGMAPNAIAGETRRIPVTDNTGRVHTFWVAPTRQASCRAPARPGRVSIPPRR